MKNLFKVSFALLFICLFTATWANQVFYLPNTYQETTENDSSKIKAKYALNFDYQSKAFKQQNEAFGKELWGQTPSKWQVNAKKPQAIEYLGWLYVYNQILNQENRLENAGKAAYQNYKDVIVLGMGGSSLGVEVLRSVFGKEKGYPALQIFDSSNPDQLLDLEKKLDLTKTLFIVSSKSGTTAETLYGYYYFYDKLAKLTDNPGKHFVAITDKGSFLDKEATEKDFLYTFLNRTDIGGRFSVLSYFGMAPAALAGYDIEGILESAQEYSVSLKNGDSLPLILAKTITQSETRTNATMYLKLDKSLYSFGLWIEQLLSESLGKAGKGVVPVIVKDLPCPKQLKEGDSLVILSYKEQKIPQGYNVPVIVMQMQDKKDIGQQFLLWEVATTYSGKLLNINPFDQPDVALAKAKTSQVLKEVQAGKTFDLSPVAYANIKQENNLAKTILDQANNPETEYITLLAYANPTKANQKALNSFAKTLQKKVNKPVIITYGPRYLHSLGQMFKGGANKGLFLLFVGSQNNAMTLKGDFKELFLAQAFGDFEALKEKDRKAIKVYLDKTPLKTYLKDLKKSL